VDFLPGGNDHGWFFLGFAVLLVGGVVILFFRECFRWVLSICLDQEWRIGLHIRGCGSVVWVPMANLGFRGVG